MPSERVSMYRIREVLRLSAAGVDGAPGGSRYAAVGRGGLEVSEGGAGGRHRGAGTAGVGRRRARAAGSMGRPLSGRRSS
jgi:hypothetical protein